MGMDLLPSNKTRNWQSKTSSPFFSHSLTFCIDFIFLLPCLCRTLNGLSTRATREGVAFKRYSRIFLFFKDNLSLVVINLLKIDLYVSLILYNIDCILFFPKFFIIYFIHLF